MHLPKVDFLKPSSENESKRAKAPFPAAPEAPRKLFFIIIFFIAAITGVVIINRYKPSGDKANTSKTFSFLNSLRSLIGSGDRELKGEGDGRINILVLGIGGVGHEGTNLTDTIILLSIDPKTKRIGLLSIPRDLLVPIPGYGYKKINNANSFGEEAFPGSGGLLAKKTVEDLLGINVPYYIRVDFAGFRQLIDELGGVTIEVTKDFTDSSYPTEDFKTQTVTFYSGRQLMDGEKALQYVRSRHGGGGEGSDFARGKRQQKLLLGIRDKVLSRGMLVNPAKILRVYQTLSEHISTDLESWELLRLANMIKDVNSEKITKHTLETVPEGPLLERIIDGAFVLLPESGSWDELREAAQNIFSVSRSEESKRENALTIEIQNGTVIPGFAAGVAELLKRSGYQIIKIGNAKNRDYEKTVIYEQQKKDEYPEELIKIKTLLDANVSPIPPAYLGVDLENGILRPQANNRKIADFLIILGNRSVALIQPR